MPSLLLMNDTSEDLRQQLGTYAKTGPECLSRFRLMDIATGAAALAGDDAKHVESCPHCTARLEEQRGFVSAPIPRMPENIRAAIDANKTRAMKGQSLWYGVGLSVAALACVFTFVFGHMPESSSPDDIMIKGKLDFVGTLVRNGSPVAETQPLGSLPHVQAHDLLRLRVVGQASGFVLLEGLDNGKWVTIYRGPLPEDRWIPQSVEFDDAGKSQLRVTLCPQEGATNCDTTVLDF